MYSIKSTFSSQMRKKDRFSHGYSILIVILLALICHLPPLFSQEKQDEPPAVKFENLRFPISSKAKKLQAQSLNNQVAVIIEKTLNDLYLYDILVALPVDSAFLHGDGYTRRRYTLNSYRVKDFLEAIIVTSAQIYQEGIPPDSKESFFSIEKTDISDPDNEKYQDNIFTFLSVESYFLDLQSGEYLGDFNFEVVHTGGNRDKSKTEAMNLFQKKVSNELKRIYWISADIDSAGYGTITIPLGTNQGVKKDWMFEIVEPDRVWEYDGDEFMTIGGPVGFAIVTDTSAESSQLRVIRQWDDYFEGSWVVEHLNPVYALILKYSVPSKNSYFNTGIEVQVRSTRGLDWGFGAHFMQVTDSYDEKDNGFGINTFGQWRFFNRGRFDLGARFGINLDIPFKKDDGDQVVNTLLFSTAFSLTGELLLTAHSDIVFNIGYRFGAKNDAWSYSEDEESFEAFWWEDPPAVKNSGIIISVGYKYYLF